MPNSSYCDRPYFLIICHTQVHALFVKLKVISFKYVRIQENIVVPRATPLPSQFPAHSVVSASKSAPFPVLRFTIFKRSAHSDLILFSDNGIEWKWTIGYSLSLDFRVVFCSFCSPSVAFYPFQVSGRNHDAGWSVNLCLRFVRKMSF